MTCPTRAPGQPLDAHQREVAAWVGCGVEALNALHDRLHAALCDWLGIPSHSLACARGEPFDELLAAIEEATVMELQRLMVRHGVMGVPM